MRTALLWSLLLASCVTPAQYEALEKTNRDLSARFERNQVEGWTKEERAAFRAEQVRQAKRIEEVKPPEWRAIADYVVYGAIALLLGDTAGLTAMLRRRRRKAPGEIPHGTET